jgi:hypothetical protein
LCFAYHEQARDKRQFLHRDGNFTSLMLRAIEICKLSFATIALITESSFEDIERRFGRDD